VDAVKPLIYAFGGVGLSAWAAVEAAVRMVAQAPIGTDAGVSVVWVFQAGVLVTAGFFLVRFGMLLASWKRALDKAVRLGEQMTKLEERIVRAEDRLEAHDNTRAQQQLLIQEHAARLGLRGMEDSA
jgi:sulfite exporter TauE/SafE